MENGTGQLWRCPQAAWPSELQKTLDKLYHANLISSPWCSFIHPPHFETRFKMQLRKNDDSLGLLRNCEVGISLLKYLLKSKFT